MAKEKSGKKSSGNNGGNSHKVKQARIDMKKRFPLRIDAATHLDIETFCFARLSINLYYQEALNYLNRSDAFRKHMEEKYPRDERLGHFKFFSDENTMKPGRLVE